MLIKVHYDRTECSLTSSSTTKDWEQIDLMPYSAGITDMEINYAEKYTGHLNRNILIVIIQESITINQ